MKLNTVYKIKEEILETPEQQLLQAMNLEGLCPDSIFLDGTIHRFTVDNSKDAGWYIGYNDNIPAGSFGNWKTSEVYTWKANIGRELTTAERMAQSRLLAKIKEKREIELAKKHEIAKNNVEIIWENAGLASDEHPYLKRKGVKAHGLRITGDGRLIAPLFDKEGKISSIQYIDGKGQKQFQKDGTVKECFLTLGTIGQECFVAEGFATGATIYECTDIPTVITYSAGNIFNTVKILREKNPTLKITIIADNDKSGVGQAKAEQAAAKYGSKVIVSPVKSDVNDYVQQGGDLLELLEPKKEENWLTMVDQFCAKPKPIRWLVKKWIQDNAMIMVHGPSGCGKTFLVLDWCLSIASGKEKWQQEKIRKGNVIYLAGEGHNGLRGRIAAWIQTNKPEQEISMAISKSGVDLNTPEGLQKTLTSIRDIEMEPNLIVVDTLHRFLKGDENSAQDTKTMLDSCAILMQEFKCSVLLVHHTGVSPEAQHRARGSSAWKGALDIEISIKKAERDPNLTVIQRKNKDNELADDVNLELNTVELKGWFDEDGEQITSAVLEKGEKKSRFTKKQLEQRQLILLAWEYGGRKILDNNPYISYEKIKEFFIEKKGKTPESVRKMLLDDSSRFLGQMLAIRTVEKMKNGLIIIDSLLKNVCFLTCGQNGQNLDKTVCPKIG